MKRFQKISFILILFLITGNVLSEDNIFNVNNISLTKKQNTSNEQLANQAIKQGFNELIDRILLKEDKVKLSKLDFHQIKDLVLYYQVVSEKKDNEKLNDLNFNIFFDKEKIHDLFFKIGVLYSEVENRDLYILPIQKRKDQIFIYNDNFFYENWNKVYKNELIEFILPLENIEVLQKINSNKTNILSLNLKNIFQEYLNQNLALIIIDESNLKNEKIYIKTKILGKNIEKNFLIKRSNLDDEDYDKKIIYETSNELVNIIKSQNLIDIRTPSFINAKFFLNKKNNLVELNKKLQKIDLIDEIFIQEFNNEFVLLKIKYLGKLNKIIRQLENQSIILKMIGEKWSLEIV